MLHLFLCRFIHLRHICSAEVLLKCFNYEAKTLLFAVILMMTITGSSFVVRGAMFPETDGDIPIIVQPYDPTPIGEPRGPVFNPFTAYRLNNIVVLESDTSYGLVGVTLASTAGDYYTPVFDTEDGSVLIPVSGNAGNYTLLLTDSVGAQFVGTFEI